jgi:hypothetical protein
MSSITQIIEMLVYSNRMWKEAEMIYNKILVLTRKLPQGTEGNHQKAQTEEPVSGPRFEADTSRTRKRKDRDVLCKLATCLSHTLLIVPSLVRAPRLLNRIIQTQYN